jgi:lysozyme family protein
VTEHEIIDGVLQREGGYRNVPGDRGGPTNYGITAETYANWRGWTRPASAAEIQNMPVLHARMIYFQRFIAQPGFTEDAIPFEPLRVQLIDFGVNSGSERAIRWLQRLLQVPVTGKLD